MSETIINVNYFAEAESEGVFDDPSNYTLIMSADFVNDVYELNGSSSTLTALFDGTDPSGFDAEGMSTVFSGTNFPLASSALLSALWAGMDNGLTIVFDIDYNGLVDDLLPAFFLSDNADMDLATNYIESYGADGFISVADTDEFSSTDPDTWDIGFSAVGDWNGDDLIGRVGVALVLSRYNGTNYEYEITYSGSLQAALGTTTYNQKTKLGTLSGFNVFCYEPWGYGHNLTTTRIRSLKVYEAMSSQAALRASAEGLPLTMVTNATTDAKKDFTFPSFRPYASGGKPPYQFSLQAGTLPAGLSIDEMTGEVTGTPTALGTSSGLVIRALDANGDPVDSDAFSITIRDRLLLYKDHKTGSGTTFASAIFGEANSDRWIIVAGGNSTVTSMTIGGVTARRLVVTSSSGDFWFWYAQVPTGTTGDIVVSPSPGATVTYKVFAYYGPGLVVHDARTNTTNATSQTISNIKQRSDGLFLALSRLTNPERVNWTGVTRMKLTDRAWGNQGTFGAAIKYTDTDSGSSDVSTTTSPSTSHNVAVVSFMQTGPELIGASTVSYLTSGTTRTTVVPSGVLENDLMLVAVFHRSALTSIPSGWTLVASEDCTGASVTQYCSVYKKNAASGDAGTTITWTQTSAGRMAAQLLAWRDAAGTLSVLSSAQSSQDTDTTSSNVHDFPEVTGTADDQVFFIAASSILGGASNISVTVPDEYFLASPANVPENRLEVAWRLGDNGEVSSGTFTTSISGSSENGVAKVAVLIGL